MLTREQVKKKLKGFETGKEGRYNGISLFLPLKDDFCEISFGDGTNADSLEPGCDDYIYIEVYPYENCGFSSESKGGQLDFNTKTAGYENDITNAVYDALELVYDYVPDFIPLKNIVH